MSVLVCLKGVKLIECSSFEPMNTSAQVVHFNMDELPVSRFTDTAEDGVSRLDPSIHSNQICFFNVD